MKRTIAFITGLVFFISCTKDDNLQKNAGEGFWSLEDEQYTITKTERSSSSGYFILTGNESASSTNRIQVYFQNQPAASGKFKVVAFEDNIQLKSNEIGIRVSVQLTGRTYSSTGISDNQTWSPAPDVNVTLSTGKIKVDIPKMTTSIWGSNYTDTASLKGVVIEK